MLKYYGSSCLLLNIKDYKTFQSDLQNLFVEGFSCHSEGKLHYHNVSKLMSFIRGHCIFAQMYVAFFNATLICNMVNGE